MSETSKTSDMVEQVARAICAKVDCDYDGILDSAKEEYRSLARAVIAAMRDPTDKMNATGVSKAFGIGLDGPDGVGPSDAAAIFTAMIDAALEETPEAGE